MSLDDFNDTVNGFMDPFTSNEYIFTALNIFLVLYGSLAAPKIPISWSPYFANTWIRILVMIMIVWIFNKDPATSIMVAVSYYLTMHYLMKNSLNSIAQTGVVTPEIALLMSGGSGPTIKPASVVKSEAALMQASVDQARAPGFVTTPEALLSSGPVSTAATAAIPNVPSGTPANVSSMMASQPGGGEIPLAYTPDDVHDLAVAPR